MDYVLAQVNIGRLRERERPIHAALDDPRPLFVGSPSVKAAAHVLERTLDALAASLPRVASRRMSARS